MYPIILVSKSTLQIEKYLSDFCQEKSLSSSQLLEIKPEKNEISINQIRQLRKRLNVESQAKRLIVFYSFDTASYEAQNALLKTLEEKTFSNYFVMIVNKLETLLDTTISRSKVIDLREAVSFSDVFLTVRPEVIDLIKSITNSGDARFLNSPLVAEIDRESAVILIQEILYCLWDMILTRKTHNVSMIKKGFYYLKLLQNNNVNPQLTIDNFLLYIQRELVKQS